MKEATRGVLLIAFGDPSYGKWAHNLAISLRYFHPDVKIHLCAWSSTLKDVDLSLFTSHEIDPVLPFNMDGSIDTAAAKMQIFDLSPFDQTIYLDVDALILQPIEPLFDRIFKDHHVYFQVMDQGGRDKSLGYNWVEPSTAWKHFELKEDAIYSTSQTSIVAFDRSKEAVKFFDQLNKNYANKVPEMAYTIKWGRSFRHADELYYSGTAAQLGITPDFSLQPILYPSVHRNDLSNVRKEYYILSFWGAQVNVKPWAKDAYERLMIREYCPKSGRTHLFKCHHLYSRKFAGAKA